MTGAGSLSVGRGNAACVDRLSSAIQHLIFRSTLAMLSAHLGYAHTNEIQLKRLKQVKKISWNTA